MKESGVVIEVVFVINGIIVNKKEGSCELGENGWEVVDLKFFFLNIS